MKFHFGDIIKSKTWDKEWSVQIVAIDYHKKEVITIIKTCPSMKSIYIGKRESYPFVVVNEIFCLANNIKRKTHLPRWLTNERE